MCATAQIALTTESDLCLDHRQPFYHVKMCNIVHEIEFLAQGRICAFHQKVEDVEVPRVDTLKIQSVQQLH